MIVHRYIVVTVTHRGKYAVTGFTYRTAAETFLATQRTRDAIYDAVLFET